MFVLTAAKVFKKEIKESQFLFDKFVWKKNLLHLIGLYEQMFNHRCER